jgi:CheY-like chemotaxis protein
MTDAVAILVVDDNPPMARTMADILVAKGYRVQAVCSGREALDIMERERVDILLMDVIMPEMDGVVLNRRAKEIQPRIFSVFMTAYSADDLIQQGIKEGVSTVLPKPVDIDFLLSLISAADVSYFHPVDGRGHASDRGNS